MAYNLETLTQSNQYEHMETFQIDMHKSNKVMMK